MEIKALYETVLNIAKGFSLVGTSAGKCLADRKRTLTLMEIISDTVPKNSGCIGIDLGAGSGILGFAFLNAGGSRLYSVEHEGSWANFINIAARHLGFGPKIEVYTDDVLTFQPPEAIDYAIAELVGTGLAAEPLVEAIGNIRRHTNENALFIPEGAVSKLTLLGGHGQPMSNAAVYDDVSLPSLNRKGVDAVVRLCIQKDGIPEKAAIDTALSYPNGRTTGRFKSLCLRENIPLVWDSGVYMAKDLAALMDNSVPHFNGNGVLKQGDNLTIYIRYEYGSWYHQIDARVVAAQLFQPLPALVR